MKISDLGGEFALIKRITRDKYLPEKVIKGIGDDCAVLKLTDTMYQLVTTDMMVENDHFNLAWHTPYQVGWKLMESNVSDIVCKGGVPEFAFLSMSLKKDTTVEFMDQFYNGLYASAEKHEVYLTGGDTTHGTEYVFNLTLTGYVDRTGLRLRSMARVGDLICVTGKLGGSTAGLKLLIKNLDGYLQKHLEPEARTVEEGRIIAAFAHAMIDVSDGLGSEVTHICRESGVGAEIDYEAIPLSEETCRSAALLGTDPHDFALYGGEDYEIVFTIAQEQIPALKQQFSDFTVVGSILDRTSGIFLVHDGKKMELKKGYDHFS